MQKMPYSKLAAQYINKIRAVDKLSDIYESDDEIVFELLLENNELVAYVAYKQFEMKNIYMIYSFKKNMGYATKLLKKLEGSIILEVRTTNKPAIKLYENLDFIRQRTITNLYPECDGYVYVRYND